MDGLRVTIRNGTQRRKFPLRLCAFGALRFPPFGSAIGLVILRVFWAQSMGPTGAPQSFQPDANLARYCSTLRQSGMTWDDVGYTGRGRGKLPIAGNAKI